MKIKDGFVVRRIADVAYAVAVGERSREVPGMCKLTDTGELLWKELSEDRSREYLIERLTAEYDVDKDVAARDIDAFLKKLAEANLLEGEL